MSDDAASAASRFDHLVAVGLAAARPLERALLSLDPVHQRAAKELAAFLLGIFRTLETLDGGTLEAWRARIVAETGRDVLDLCRRTGDPTFTDAAFLAFLKTPDERLP